MRAPNVELIIKTVKKMGGQVKTISKDRHAYRVNLSNKSFVFISKFAIKNDLISSPLLAKYKDLTYETLKSKGLKMPKTFTIKTCDSPKKILKLISSLNFPLVIKDAQGSESKGIFSNVLTIKDALKIISEVKNKYSHLIVQERAKGREYRILILNNIVLAALEFIPPYIIGDGENTTEKLILKLQKNTPEKTPRDTYLKKLLGDQKEKLNSIPAKNKKIFLRKNACMAEGGTSIDATEKISPIFSKILAKAVKSLGMRLGGIDVFCEDIEKGERNYQIIEINGKPDLYIHNEPTIGKSINVAKPIIKYIIKL